MKKVSMKKKWIIPAVLLVAAGLVFAPSLLADLTGSKPAGGPPEGPGGMGADMVAGMGPGAGKNTATVFTVRTEDAEIRSLEAYIEVNGNIVSEQQVTVVPEAGGKLVSMRVELGSYVQKGALVAQVDPSRPGAEYSLSPVYAPVSGLVVTSPAPEGSTVSTATQLFTVAVSDRIEIEARIPEREVGQLRTGLKAEVRFEAFPGEVFNAEVTRLSPVVDQASRTKKITLRLVTNDSRVNPGMFARIKLNTRVYENVVSIPKEALVETRGKTVVYVLNQSGQAGAENSIISSSNINTNTINVSMREVETGVSIDSELEIKNGLAAGEKVVVQGQHFLSDGAAVRLLATNNGRG